MKHAGLDELRIEGQMKMALPLLSLEVVVGCGDIVRTMMDRSEFLTGWCGLEQHLVVQYVNVNELVGMMGYPERDERCCGAGMFMDRGDGDTGTAIVKKRKVGGGAEGVIITLSSITRVSSSRVFRLVTNRVLPNDRNVKQQKKHCSSSLSCLVFEKELSAISPAISAVHVTDDDERGRESGSRRRFILTLLLLLFEKELSPISPAISTVHVTGDDERGRESGVKEEVHTDTASATDRRRVPSRLLKENKHGKQHGYAKNDDYDNSKDEDGNDDETADDGDDNTTDDGTGDAYDADDVDNDAEYNDHLTYNEAT
eukprot:CAMPEP_0172518720 /NCGR_PEP_ID=MMETSP1066-20121228/290987_1 /TAXON_ID=671091 /ORGANISM="Coscinodiscus wailesii, Strain CCMP2513" /LENGTH=313 /DNA_ID=CAMNT_0013301161 /DNA_START=334 /DNA_END=1276 /DNA_ORIENTATION=-